MAAILRDSTVVVAVVVVVRTRPRAIPLAMITMRKSTHGFPFVSHIWVTYGAPLGGPLGRRSSAKKTAIKYFLQTLRKVLKRNRRRFDVELTSLSSAKIMLKVNCKM